MLEVTSVFTFNPAARHTRIDEDGSILEFTSTFSFGLANNLFTKSSNHVSTDARGMQQKAPAQTAFDESSHQDRLTVALATTDAEEGNYAQHAIPKISLKEQTDEDDFADAPNVAGTHEDHQCIAKRLRRATFGRNIQELSDAIVQAEVTGVRKSADERLLLTQAKQTLRMLKGQQIVARETSR